MNIILTEVHSESFSTPSAHSYKKQGEHYNIQLQIISSASNLHYVTASRNITNLFRHGYEATLTRVQSLLKITSTTEHPSSKTSLLYSNNGCLGHVL